MSEQKNIILARAGELAPPEAAPWALSIGMPGRRARMLPGEEAAGIAVLFLPEPAALGSRAPVRAVANRLKDEQ